MPIKIQQENTEKEIEGLSFTKKPVSLWVGGFQWTPWHYLIDGLVLSPQTLSVAPIFSRLYKLWLLLAFLFPIIIPPL